MSSTVTVNLNVNVDATGNIEVFGYTETIPTSKIVSKTKIPVTALYSGDSEGGLIEFWESTNDLGNIQVELAHTDSTAYGGFNFSPEGVPYYKTCAKRLALGIESVLCNKFDCSASEPFNDAIKYAGNTNYTEQRDFGRLALSAYAHSLFGHMAATAAITNDSSFMKNMINVSEDSVKSTTANDDPVKGPYNRYLSYDKRNTISAQDVLDWPVTSDTLNANLAIRIVREIIKKGIDAQGNYIISDVNTVKNAASGSSAKKALAGIVAQVIGQDASRAMGQDNNALVPEVRHLLKFMDGDKIYLQINLQKPEISVYGGNTSVQEAYDSINAVNTSYSFTLEITLGTPDASIILADTLPANVDIDSVLNGITVDNTNTLTVTNNVTSLISNASTLEEQSLIRNAIVNNIFNNNQSSVSITNPADLGLSMTGINSVILYNYSQLPTENGTKFIDFNQIGATEGVYIGFNSIGSSILLKNSSTGFSGILTQVSATKYMFGGLYYNVGQSFTFSGKSIVLGSVSAAPVFTPIDPISVSYSNQEITLTYSSNDAVTNILAMAYRVDGNPWVNGQIAGIDFTKSGNTITIPNIYSSPITMVFDIWFSGAEAPKRYTHTFANVTAAAYDSVTYDAANQRLVLQFNSVNDMTAASIVTAMYYNINNGAWSNEQLLGSGFTVSGEYLYINNITFAPNRFEADVFYSTQPTPINKSTVMNPYIQTSVNPSSVVYDEFDQKLVFTYPSVTQNGVSFDAVYVAGSISRIDFILDEKYDTTGWIPPFRQTSRGNNTLIQQGANIIIENVLRTPQALDIATILHNGNVIQAGPTRGTYTVPTVNNVITGLTAVNPNNSFLYNSFEQTVTIEYPTNANASAIGVIDVDIWNGTNWSGFARYFTRSADGSPVVTRIGAKIILPGITSVPVAMRAITIYRSSIGNSDVNYGVSLFYYSPVAPVSISYNPNITTVRLEYSNAGVASSVNTIDYDRTYTDGASWSGFNRLIRSGSEFPTFTRNGKYIYISNIPVVNGNNPTHARIIAFFDKPGSTPSDINKQVNIDTSFTV